MAYRYEKNLNNEKDLVIDGFEKGIADSPYQGIANMRNFNTRYYEGVAYVNYKRQLGTTAGGNQVFTGSTSPSQLTLSGALTLVVGDAVTVSNSGGALPTGLAAATTYFVQAVAGSVFQLSATYGGSAITITGTGSGTNTVTLVQVKKPKFSCTSPAGLNYVLDSSGQVWKQSAVNANTFFLLTGNPLTSADGQGIAFWQGYLFVFRASAIDICGTGVGDAGVISTKWNANATTANAFWPISAPSSVIFTGSLSAAAVGATLSSYNDPSGAAQTSWVLPTGVYQLTTSVGELVSATFTFASTAVTFASPLKTAASSSVTVKPIFSSTATTGSPQHMAIVSGNDGNLYFCNGQFVGSLSVPSGYSFQLSAPATYAFNYAALPLPQYETSVWLSELGTDMAIAGVKKLYFWNFVSLTANSYFPVPENIDKIINVLNKLYVFAGQKGNIYWSNGYSVNPLKKIPDSITSQGGNSANSTPFIDPVWSWGGIMSHRRKLFFQALASTPAGTNLIAGIFSLDVDTNVINFENQNSFGLISSTTTASGVLIDNTPSANGNDSYYSGWSNGNSSAGGIDYNDTTLYSSNEPIIESDLIPIGTFFQNRTFGSAEFKLDQPMQSGDSLTLYARQSLADTYVAVGTTTTAAVLSNGITPLGFQNWQWIQFKVTASCNPTSTSSSFVRLREIRIR